MFSEIAKIFSDSRQPCITRQFVVEDMRQSKNSVRMSYANSLEFVCLLPGGKPSQKFLT